MLKKSESFCLKYQIPNMLVIGDFNSRNLEWGDTRTNHRGRFLLDYVENSQFTLLTPGDRTFVCPDGGSVIDLLLVKGPIGNSVTQNWIDKSVDLGSGAPIRGHYPVMTRLCLANESVEKKTIFDFKNTEWEKWGLEVDNFLNNSTTGQLHSNQASLQYFMQGMEQASQSIPKKVVSRHSKPFWTSRLTQLYSILKDAAGRVNRRATPTNVLEMKQARVLYNEAVLEEKNNWIRDKLANINVADSVQFWKSYKGLFGQKTENYVGNLISNDILYMDDKGKESVLFSTFLSGEHLNQNNFDGSFAQHIELEYQTILNDDFNTQPSSPSDDLEFIKLNKEMTMYELKSAIARQKCTGKCSDRDDIHPIMLKHLGGVALDWLLQIFNDCLRSGQWLWKISDVVFIKKPDKANYLDPGSYRPITISSYIGKLLERILESRIREFCGVQDIIDECQEGFRPKRSTTRYLFKMMTSLTEAKKKKLTSMILFLDFRKAFDSVWLNGLVVKLHRYGVRGFILKLINTFLNNREVTLRFNGKTHSLRKCGKIGVPQGSVLSPLLFIIYVADMLQDVEEEADKVNVGTYKFADDGTVSVIATDVLVCYTYMQRICDKLNVWCNHWRMKINCDRNKTEVIIVSQKDSTIHTSIPPKLQIGQDYIEYVEKSKVLGIIIDNKLSFNHHASKILKSCWYDWWKISKKTNREYGLNLHSLRLLFQSIIMPKILYASIIWLDNQLDTFKNFFARAILKICGGEYYPQLSVAHMICNVPPLELQHKVNCTKFLLKGLLSDDATIAAILSIDQNVRHKFNIHTNSLKSYLLWKNQEEGDGTSDVRNRARNIALSNYVMSSKCLYTKVNMKQHSIYLWHEQLKNKFPNKPINLWHDSGINELFPKGSSRKDNTTICDFLHGHCSRFGNFSKTVQISTSDTCTYCNNESDSPEHQLFSCVQLASEYREDVMALLEDDVTEFTWRTLTGPMNDTACNVFRHLALDIAS